MRALITYQNEKARKAFQKFQKYDWFDDNEAVLLALIRFDAVIADCIM